MTSILAFLALKWSRLAFGGEAALLLVGEDFSSVLLPQVMMGSCYHLESLRLTDVQRGDV